ncbi:MAG: 4a-hydroxytetrahydrobiopterin dehydratase [Actinomycetia bacterium]|nr:4a-hydroxytetrahydrobiopterin dehydratase [Actinomycetes bacterium]
MATDLNADQIDHFLSEHPQWALKGASIQREFIFDDFNQALGFVVRIGAASEAADHHPDIDIRWNKVTCLLSTRSKGALTSKDLALAAKFGTLS